MNSLKLNFNIDFSKHSIYNEKNAKINGLEKLKCFKIQLKDSNVKRKQLFTILH